MLTAVRFISDYAAVLVVPHSVALDQQTAPTVQVQNEVNDSGIEVLPVGHTNLSSDGLTVAGHSLTKTNGSGSCISTTRIALPQLVLSEAMM